MYIYNEIFLDFINYQSLNANVFRIDDAACYNFYDKFAMFLQTASK